jgi:hypothetical protein
MLFMNLCFLHGPELIPITIMLNFNGLLVVSSTFFLNLHLIFLVLTMKIYQIICFRVQLSEFLIQGNGLPSQLAVTSGSVQKYWLMHSRK